MRNTRLITRTAVGSLGYSLVGNVFLYLGQLLIARGLDRPDYATYATVISFISLMATFADLGWASPLVRSFADAEARAVHGDQDKRGELLGSILASKLLLGLLSAGASIVVAEWLYGPAITELIVIGTLTFLISSRMLVVRVVLESFLRAEGKLSTVLKLAALDAGGFAVLMVILTQERLGLGEVVWAYSLCHLPGFLLLLWQFNRTLIQQQVSLRFSAASLRSFAVGGLPVTIGVWLMAVHNMADTLLLNALSTSKEVSAFSAAFRLMSGLLFIPVVIAGAVAPEVTKGLARGDRGRASLLAGQGLHYALLVAVLAALFVTASAPALVNVLLGTHYQDAIHLVLIFGWMFIPITIGAYALEMTVVTGGGRLYIVYCAVLAVFTVVGNLIFAAQYGAMGAVIVKLAGLTVGCVLLARYFSSDTVGQQVFRRPWLKMSSLIAGCLSTLYLLYAVEAAWVIRVSALLAVFIALALALRLVQPTSLRMVYQSITQRGNTE